MAAHYTALRARASLSVDWPEAATELVRSGLEDLKLATLVAITQTTNTASQRVLEKAGLSRERDILHGGTPVSLYRIRAKSLYT